MTTPLDSAAAQYAAASLEGRVCLVTGAAGAMGRVLSTELARAGATVVIACRTVRDGQVLRSTILERVPGARVEVESGDLSRQAEVRALAARVLDTHDRLHVLVNNAGALFPRLERGPDGIERHLAVNHLAGFLLTRSLLPALRAAESSRVINVVTDMINDTRLVKLSHRPRPAVLVPTTLEPPAGSTPLQAYAGAKLATLMSGNALAEELAGTGVTVNAVHPGVVSSPIISGAAPPATAPLIALYRRFLLTPEAGARPIVRLATDVALADVTGRYYVRFDEARAPVGGRTAALAQYTVAQTSRRLVGL